MSTLLPDKKQRIDAVLKNYVVKMADLRKRREKIVDNFRLALKEKKLKQLRDEIIQS
jgi:hypothetical protein